MLQSRLLALDGLSGPLAFGPGTGPVAGGLIRVLRGWHASAAGGGTPLATVSETPDGFLVERHDTGWDLPQQTAVGAVCQLVVEAVDLMVHADDRFGALHAGAVAFGERLVLLPARRRAGKSTLVAALAALGETIVADDLVLFETASGDALATGCLPRLRLPLPDSAGPGLRAFVEAATVLGDGYYAYVDPGEDTHAAHGRRFRFGAIVVPERMEEPGPARLEPMTEDDALLSLLTQDTRREADTSALFAFHRGLAATLPAWRLSYWAPEDGAACLVAAFAGETANWASRTTATVEEDAATPETGDGPYRPQPGVALHEVGDRAFLVRSETGDIHHLDPVGRAVWLLAMAGEDEAGIAAVLAEAFHGTDPATIAADVRAVLADLVGENLMLAPQPPA